MKAVILAAGTGTRLRPITETLPKCLMEVGGKTLLEHSLDALNENNITDVIIVTGFYEELVKSKFGEKYKEIKIKYVRNERFSETGSMYSLSQVRNIIGNDSILILESDLMYEPEAITTILNSELKDVILTAELLHSGDDVYVCTNEKGEIINLGKNISEEEKVKASGALVGISKYSKEFLVKLFEKAEEDYRNNKLNYHYEECVFTTSRLGHPVYTLFCSGLNWIEIDNEDDLKRAREEIYPKLEDKKREITINFPKVRRNILLNPGPATTTDTVKYAQVVPDICPREEEFSDLMKSINNDLVQIAGGDEDYTCVLFGGSGTAAMDSVINSVVPPDTKILVINNGAYGERLAKIAHTYKIPCIEMACEWDKLPDVRQIKLLLDNNPEISCVAIVHHETTTGLLNPVEEIGEIVKKYNKLFVVDTISSFAGVPLNIKKFKIDFMMSTSNKCIQGMAGVCFVICKKEELEKLKDFSRRSFYLSLYDQYKYFQEKHQMRFTPPVQTLYALRKAIDEFLREGHENRVARYVDNWKTLREGVEEIGLKVLTDPKEESKLLITVLYPDNLNFNFNELHDKLYERGFTIYPGKVGKMDSFRLANMGDINKEDINQFLFYLEEILVEMGVNLL